MKNIDNLFVRLFVISLSTFRYFSTIVSLFGAGAAPLFTAPTKMCRLRRLRLRLRLRIPAVNSYFWSKSEEHDITLTSLTADLPITTWDLFLTQCLELLPGEV